MGWEREGWKQQDSWQLDMPFEAEEGLPRVQPGQDIGEVREDGTQQYDGEEEYRGRPIERPIVVQPQAGGTRQAELDNDDVNEVVARYQQLFGITNTLTIDWYEQTAFTPGAKNPWSRANRPGPTPAAWIRHLDWSDAYWLGWSCPKDKKGRPVTQHIVFDIDAKAAHDRQAAADVASRLIAVWGEPWFVAKSPSFGYHVYYRLSEPVGLDDVITGPTSGPVAVVTHGQGLDLGPAAKLELFPRPDSNFRAPLGTRQSLVDPESLEDLGLASLAECLDYIESRSHLTIDLDDLRARARRTVRTGGSRKAFDLVEAKRFYEEGMTGNGQRDAAMDLIAMALLRSPGELGFDAAPTVPQVAAILVDWLEKHGHNSRDYSANPSRDYWLRQAARKVAALAKSSRSLEHALQTQLSETEVGTILGCSDIGLDLEAADAGRTRLLRERFGFALLNFAKYACLEHETPIGPGSAVRIGAATLRSLPGANAATYLKQLGWLKQVGFVRNRGSSYSKKRALAKELTMDLDPGCALSAEELQVLLDIHVWSGIDVPVVAHALHLTKAFDTDELESRYGQALPRSLLQQVRDALAGSRAQLN